MSLRHWYCCLVHVLQLTSLRVVTKRRLGRWRLTPHQSGTRSSLNLNPARAPIIEKTTHRRTNSVTRARLSSRFKELWSSTVSQLRSMASLARGPRLPSLSFSRKLVFRELVKSVRPHGRNSWSLHRPIQPLLLLARRLVPLHRPDHLLDLARRSAFIVPVGQSILVKSLGLTEGSHQSTGTTDRPRRLSQQQQCATTEETAFASIFILTAKSARDFAN